MKTTAFSEFLLFIEFDYSPPERKTMNYPGCAEGAEITRVEVAFSGLDISSALGEVAVDQLRMEALEYVREISERDES
jgi:hypothetical protein